MYVIGLMSGTSLDGVDAALVEIQRHGDELEVVQHSFGMEPFDPALRALVRSTMPPEHGTTATVCELHVALGELFARAAQQSASQAGIPLAQIDLIASHGQTVYHQVAPGQTRSTLQLGAPAIIAERTGCSVVADFRLRDLAAGGQGAPLVPLFDQLLFSGSTSRAVQNIGGIGNVTYLPTHGTPLAFDTGPGNLLIDEAMQVLTDTLFDRDGALAAAGQINEQLLTRWLEHPFFAEAPPKSTGREAWGPQAAAIYLAEAQAAGLSPADTLATLTALTAESIAESYRRFLGPVDEVILGGGGARNPTLIRMLQNALPESNVTTSEEYGLDSMAKEAVAFATLGYLSVNCWPGNAPWATGAQQPVVLGSITPGPRYRELLRQIGASDLPPPRASTLYAGNAPRSYSVSWESNVSDTPQRDHQTWITSSLTEQRNAATMEIDTLDTAGIVAAIVKEDTAVPLAVGREAAHIARLADIVVERIERGGRLIYIGAGTSGRLGILDAAECPPTFGISADIVVARLAGGEVALSGAIESVEDDAEAGAREIHDLQVSERDVVLGIAASGRTPYVLGAVEVARALGAFTAGLACTHPSPLAGAVDLMIAPIVGPEVIAGSTRMKAGTAQKLVLNTLSTTVMIRLGKTFGNLMVDVQPTNEKLRLRAASIVAEATGLPLEEARQALEQADGHVKTAIVMVLAGVETEVARQRLEASRGHVRRALEGMAHG